MLWCVENGSEIEWNVKLGGKIKQNNVYQKVVHCLVLPCRSTRTRRIKNTNKAFPQKSSDGKLKDEVQK